MTKKAAINIILVILCVVAICINQFFDDYKIVGNICLVALGILAVLKDFKK